jgi:hypothetical protein
VRSAADCPVDADRHWRQLNERSAGGYLDQVVIITERSAGGYHCVNGNVMITWVIDSLS